MSALSVLIILALFIFLITTFGQIIWSILLGLLIMLAWYVYDWWSATKVRFVIKEDRLLMVGSWGSINVTLLFNDIIGVSRGLPIENGHNSPTLI